MCILDLSLRAKVQTMHHTVHTNDAVGVDVDEETTPERFYVHAVKVRRYKGGQIQEKRLMTTYTSRT